MYADSFGVWGGGRHYPGISRGRLPFYPPAGSWNQSNWTSYNAAWTQGAWQISGMFITGYLTVRSVAMCPAIPPDEKDATGDVNYNFWNNAYTDRWWWQTWQRYIINSNGGAAVWYDWNGCDDTIIEHGGCYTQAFFGRHGGAVWMFTSSEHGHTGYGAVGAGGYVLFGQHNDRISITFANGRVLSQDYRIVQNRFVTSDPEYCWGKCACHKGKSPGYP
jgi:hypothetical protein